MEQPLSQDHIEDTLRSLPPFVAAVVRDYCNGDEGQRILLRDRAFDPESLDALPLREDTTCEIWTDGWVWRGSRGTLSLSPQFVRPDTAPTPEVFAWVVEREMEAPQHLTVWRVRIRREEPSEIAASAEQGA